MKPIHLFLAILFACSFWLNPAETFAATVQEPFSILTVSGTGSATCAPDQAVISIGVSTHAEDASKAQEQNSTRVASIIEGLQSIGIAQTDIQTNSYSFHPTYSRQENRENEISGYQVDNTLTVTVKDIKLTGNVIDTALSHGANQIHSLNFQVRDQKKLRKGALLAAIHDAREKAEIIAAGLGHRIIGIHHVSENTGSFRGREFNTLMLAKSADSTPIEAGTLSLDADVQIEFLLDN